MTAADHRYQRNRYELKYVIDEPCARRVRDFVRCHLRRDEHAIPEMRFSYPIYSIYLDGPGLNLYRQTTQGQKNRFKLRVRYYDHDAAHPVFFEVKRRINEIIVKERAIVRRDALGGLLSGGSPRRDCLVDEGDAESYGALQHFCELRSGMLGEPKLIVYYEREAWVLPHDESVRVTFDRECAGARYDGAASALRGGVGTTLCPAKWVNAMVPGVVLELKFDNRFPVWMRELVRSCDLYRTTMGKYIQCTEQMPPADRRFSCAGGLPAATVIHR